MFFFSAQVPHGAEHGVGCRFGACVRVLHARARVLCDHPLFPYRRRKAMVLGLNIGITSTGSYCFHRSGFVSFGISPQVYEARARRLRGEQREPR